APGPASRSRSITRSRPDAFVYAARRVLRYVASGFSRTSRAGLSRPLRTVAPTPKAVMTRFINDVQGKFKLPLKNDSDGTIAHLLWGDHVQVLETTADKTRVKVRGFEGWVPSTA